MIGKILLAFGFVMTLYATTERDPVILNIGLAFLVTGMMMLVVGLYHRIRLRSRK